MINHSVYAFGPALVVTPYYYDDSKDEPDMLTYWTPGHFRGFVKGEYEYATLEAEVDTHQNICNRCTR